MRTMASPATRHDHNQLLSLFATSLPYYDCVSPLAQAVWELAQLCHVVPGLSGYATNGMEWLEVQGRQGSWEVCLSLEEWPGDASKHSDIPDSGWGVPLSQGLGCRSSLGDVLTSVC